MPHAWGAHRLLFAALEMSGACGAVHDPDQDMLFFVCMFASLKMGISSRV